MAGRKSRSGSKKTKNKAAVAAAKFIKQTCQMWHNHNRRAREHGQFLDYDTAGLRELIRIALVKGRCPYCHGNLTEENFGVDHAHPVGRDGTFRKTNLRVCCRQCNTGKGDLHELEWREILRVVNSWETGVKEAFLARLRAGASFKIRARRPKEEAEETTPVVEDTKDIVIVPTPADEEEEEDDE